MKKTRVANSTGETRKTAGFRDGVAPQETVVRRLDD
jgi:hypothetical protein